MEDKILISLFIENIKKYWQSVFISRNDNENQKK